MPDLPSDAPSILAIHLQLTHYPILAPRIRRRMREELFRRGVTTPERLEDEARTQAVQSQLREGLRDPYYEEETPTWQQRLDIVRDYLTDFHFAYNLPLELLARLIEETVAERNGRQRPASLGFNPELAPRDLLLRKAREYELLPAAERGRVQHHLEELIVVLTRTMISDQLAFVRIAKNWFTSADFQYIQERRIGSGKIGGKAAGMLLAWKILRTVTPHLAEQITIPRSYFIGADVFYDFLAINDPENRDQKYRSADEIRAGYPEIVETYKRGRFPEGVVATLRDVLRQIGTTPLIVRSSSLLEDNFGMAFAGKYTSYFCPNQGTLEQNLQALKEAVAGVYASVYSPDALFYRRHMGLLDYDERMAILLQVVEGQRHGHYYYPSLAGVAYSRSPIVWSPRLRPEEGFVRLVMGLGTRAVERVGDDYPRLITLSHPMLRPEVAPADIRRYAQRYADVIDLRNNTLATVPVSALLHYDTPEVRWVASVDQGDTILPIMTLGPELADSRLVMTFDNLLQRTPFVKLMKDVLATLTEHYQGLVDMEFAMDIQPGTRQPTLAFHLLQCRPQTDLRNGTMRPVPALINAADRLFVANRMVPQGHLADIGTLVYVDPSAYAALSESAQRYAVARVVGRLNAALEGRRFVLMGPGRWGSVNVALGVSVTYADIYNARALIELAMRQRGMTIEPSYGTHFFQDLVESQIYPLALDPDEPPDALNQDFLREARNSLTDWLPAEEAMSEIVKVIDVAAARPGHALEIAMDGERALAYFVKRET